MKKRQEIDISKLLNNPYRNTLAISATKVIDSNTFVYSKEGEAIPVERLIEKQKSTKIYQCTGCKERVYNLSPSAKSLYLYILYNLKVNVDWIHLNRDWYMKKNNVKSINTYKEAVKELSRYEFIIPTAEYKDVMWINPVLFFSGDRMRKYPDKVIVENDWIKTE